MNILFDSKINNPRISLILLDWTCRESFHIFDYLKKQTVPRDNYEIIWIEYYGKKAPEIEKMLECSEQTHEPPPLDKWIVLGIPDNVYYHKHLMYNVGIVASKSDIVCIMDSDAMVSPTFIENILAKFDTEKDIVLHLDEVRNIDQKHYPFDYPSTNEILLGKCKNWNGVTTTGLKNDKNPLLTRNYGACMCAKKKDLIEIGGADEHIDFLGHVCGPYDMTFRLVNNGRKEIWHNTEFLYHAWHPGTDGENNYIGPHDGRNNSLPALEARKSGRVLPFTENDAIKILREGCIASEVFDIPIEKLIIPEKIESWKIDESKKKISLARQTFYSSNFQGAVLLLDEIHDLISGDSVLLGYAGWANYVTGRISNARNLSNESLKLNPENCIAHKTLGWIYYKGHDYEKAGIEFTNALNTAEETNDENILEILRGKAWVDFHLGKYEEAKKEFIKALDFVPPERTDIHQDLKRGLNLSKLYLSLKFRLFQIVLNKVNALNGIILYSALKILTALGIKKYKLNNNAGQENNNSFYKHNSVPVEKVLLNADPARWESHHFGLPLERWKNLEGKSFWVTGAGTGYGRSIAVALAAAKGKVFISGRRLGKLLETIDEAEQYGIETSLIIPVICDITDEEGVKAACIKIESLCSSLYGLVNNAAIPVTEGPFPFEDISMENWNRLLATNITGQWFVTKNIFGHMLKGGSVRVIFMSSEAGWAFTPGHGPYNVTKAALNNLASSMAEEYKKHYPKLDIQMNTIIPGEAGTEMNRGSNTSPYSVVSMVLSLLSHPDGGPNGMFFHRDGRHYSFAYRSSYQKKIL